MRSLSTAFILAGLAIATPSLAQQVPPVHQTAPQQAQAGGCPAASRAEAATPPDRQSGDGTAPGNIGSTGWSGGTGGSHMGTNPQGATQHSSTWQPPTARGLDPLQPRPMAC